MARQLRKVADDSIYHVLNRGNGRKRIFNKPADFEAFIGLLEEGRKRTGMRILGYCLMDNHWHLVLWPRRGRDLSKFVAWVCTTQVRRWRGHRSYSVGRHLYGGRFRSFMVQPNEHFLTLMRFVESNPLRAKMVKRAEDWRWSSIGGAAGLGGVKVVFEKWPVDKPRDWKRVVNKKMEEGEAEAVRVSIKRGRPFGNEKWISRVVKRFGLEATVRDPWRPKKEKK
jgi:REP-associated tyrosine transposase